VNEKKSLRDATTDDLLREVAGRDDLPDAVSRLGGKALFFEAAKPEWHVAIPAAPHQRQRFSRLPTPTAVEP
jgi:hypothetical protein